MDDVKINIWTMRDRIEVTVDFDPNEMYLTEKQQEGLEEKISAAILRVIKQRRSR